MSGSIILEKAGVPVVYVVADHFIHDARSSAEDNGMPGLRMVTVPVEEYYKRRISREEVRPVAAGAFGNLVDALIRPLTQEEISTASKSSDMVQTIEITAGGYDLALEEFNRLFIENHWGSGLPMIPPTRERVEWMLEGTNRSPEEVVGTVAPKNGIATIEKIAINAVMAGAKPEYFPVIIAAMEAVTDKNFDLLHMTASTGSFGLQILVSGPIAREIGMNSGTGLLGYGWRANNTIGHAVRLCLINLGLVWPGENDMALIGRPSSHTYLTFAENEEQNPWEPYHTTAGFRPEESCVTVSTTQGYVTALGGGAVEPWTPRSILDNMVAAIERGRGHMTTWKLGSAIPSPQRHLFVLHPEFAVELKGLDFDRKRLREYLYERSSLPYENLSKPELAAFQRRIAAEEIPADRLAVFAEALRPGGRVPLLLRPEDCHFVVAGGMPGYSFVTSYFSIPPYSRTALQTKRIHGATLTAAGR